MNSGDPLERMLNELAELFKMVDENKTKPIHEKVTPEIQARIDQLKEFVEKFSDLNTHLFEASGVKQSDLDQIINNSSPNLSPKQKKVLDFSKKLKAEVETARMELTLGKTEEQPSNKKQKKADITKRKKKFKRVGGDKWLHL